MIAEKNANPIILLAKIYEDTEVRYQNIYGADLMHYIGKTYENTSVIYHIWLQSKQLAQGA